MRGFRLPGYHWHHFYLWYEKWSGVLLLKLSLAIIELSANFIQLGGVDSIGLAIDGLDKFFGFEFFEDGERAVGQQQPFAAVAFNGSDAAWRIADVRNTSTFSENV